MFKHTQALRSPRSSSPRAAAESLFNMSAPFSSISQEGRAPARRHQQGKMSLGRVPGGAAGHWKDHWRRCAPRPVLNRLTGSSPGVHGCLILGPHLPKLLHGSPTPGRRGQGSAASASSPPSSSNDSRHRVPTSLSSTFQKNKRVSQGVLSFHFLISTRLIFWQIKSTQPPTSPVPTPFQSLGTLVTFIPQLRNSD